MAQSKPTNEESTPQRENDESTPQQDNGSGACEENGGSRVPGSNLAATTMRSLSQLLDMHAATSRIFLGAQCRAAAAFGLPDYSRLFQVGDDRVLRRYSAMTDKAMEFARQAGSTFHEIQSQMSRQVEQSSINLTDRWHDGFEELQRQATESLEELKELTHQQAEEMARATESLTEATQATLREGGEQFRATVRKGLEQGREIASRQADAVREDGEDIATEVRSAGRQARSGTGAGNSGERANRPA